MEGNIPGKRSCKSKLLFMFKRPRVLTRDTMILYYGIILLSGAQTYRGTVSLQCCYFLKSNSKRAGIIPSHHCTRQNVSIIVSDTEFSRGGYSSKAAIKFTLKTHLLNFLGNKEAVNDQVRGYI